MNEILLEMRGVTKRFPGVLALDNVNLELHKGEILGICGENGAGKSTLMKVLSGSYAYGNYSGEIIIDGKKVEFHTVFDAQKSGIEMVYQENNMILNASVAENLFVGNLPSRFGWVNRNMLYGKTRELLDKVNLEIDPRMPVRLLNSGQMQLLSLMRAAAKSPRIFVLDEPTTAMTEREVDVLMDLLNKLRDEGVSILYISHKLEELFRLCERILVLRDGQTINVHDKTEVQRDVLIEEMVGRKVDNLYPKETHGFGEEVLSVENLSVPHPNIKGRNIVDNISFSVRKGEILGLGGLVGAGRSECLGAIFGQYTKNVKKEIRINGKQVQINSPQDAIRNGLGFITEERKFNGLIGIHSIRENMTLASLKAIRGKLLVDRKKEKKLVGENCEKLRIKAPSIDTKLVQLSGGNQQKVILGKWLLSAPHILLVDEPTKGIDVATKAEFYQIMSDLTKQGVTIVLVSSDLPELMAMSDRLLVLANGRITAELEKSEINEKSFMSAAIAD